MKISIESKISADKSKVWDYYTNPTHIVNWNFADPSWHCPSVENDMRVGGEYKARMEAKDGSFGFDFEAVYNDVKLGEGFSYVMDDGREVDVSFEKDGDNTKVIIKFDPESENSEEMQKEGWQSILDNFKSYVEGN